MSWQERIGQFAYTPPSGKRFSARAFEDLSKYVDKKTTAFEFPDSGETWVQDLGKTGRRIPMRFFLNGDNCDLQADIVDAILEEPGIGVLEHPMYGTLDVVVFGRIERKDELKTRANQVTFNVTFFETVRIAFPLKSESPGSRLQLAIDTYVDAVVAEFEAELDLDTTLENISLRDRYRLTKDLVTSSLQSVADVEANIQSVFDRINESIDAATSVFIDDPLALAHQTAALIQAPARSSARIGVKLTSYTGAVQALTSAGAQYLPANDSVPDNSFWNDDFMASNLLTGIALSTMFAEFETRGEAISTLDVLLSAFDEYKLWRDGNLASLVLIDTGRSYQGLLEVIAAASRFLVETSFSLKQERSIVLTAPTTPVNLEALYYGTVDENLDFLISSNSFVGSEIFEVPAGRTVVYYR